MKPFRFPRIHSLLALMVLGSALVGTSCKSDDDAGPGPDVNRPTITVTNPASLAATVSAGGAVPLQFEVADDRTLSQIRIEAHSAFDGHGHGKTAAITAWSLDTIINAAGRSTFNVTLSIGVPDSAATGPYHLIINALDESGNAAHFVEMEVTVTSPSAPTVSNFQLNGMESIDHFDVVLAGGTDSLPQTLTALVQDDVALQEIEVMVMEHSQMEDTTASPLYEAHFENLVGTSNYNLSTILPFRRADLMHNGHYHIILKVRDTEGNYTVYSRDIYVVLN